ncbi:Protein of unknown function [Nitrosomonas marina]|uniref:DUF2934 domain-containing protein n=1 Tax=Nitrosomonas marina TaxID=917 RepID=A0A1H9Y8U9_9PROT|nr:DUF2934 domain-containing protein [Nitrosomonas marina]SES65225.1 Protein of unknown function [Nitrosomonas marina]
MKTSETKPQQRSRATSKTIGERVKAAKTQPTENLELHSQIREAAYYRALERGLAPGHELDDWLTAEKEFNQ